VSRSPGSSPTTCSPGFAESEILEAIELAEQVYDRLRLVTAVAEP
jgi:hypothetical protein